MVKKRLLALTLSILVFSSFLLFSKNISSAQQGSNSPYETFVVNLTGNSLNTTSALNVTVNISPSAQLDSGITFKANGASLLLSDVNATTNLITVVWSGTVTDGKVTITGMLKPGTIAGSPIVTVTKVEASGGINITTSLTTNVTPGNSQSATPTPTPTATPISDSTPASNSNSSGGTDQPENSDVQPPTVVIDGPEQLILKRKRTNSVRLSVDVSDFTKKTRCDISTTNDTLLMITPKRFNLSDNIDSRVLIAKVPFIQALDLLSNDSQETVTITVNCVNGATDNIDLLITPPQSE